ncbi:MAG: hypothetical protein HFJ48_02330 [Clostridia bacterium]|nr:hypothetical protein [Clostridia bacterium]
MEDFLKEEQPRKLNVKKVIILILIIVAIIFVTTVIYLYTENESFRKWVDNEILPKEVTQGNTVEIELDQENTQIFAVDKYIVTLQEKTLKFYNNLGTNVGSISIDINNAIIDVSGKNFIIAEKNGKKAYVISDRKLVWETDTEGDILQIEINENGYTGIITSDMSYKNIVTLYDSLGKQVLKTYIATAKISDISISKNNQYLAIAEVDTSGVLIQSSVRIVSIETAKKDPNNSIEYVYNADLNKLILNIEYQNKERLVCMYKDRIDVIENKQSKTIASLQEKNITFSSIELNDSLMGVEENTLGNYNYQSVVYIRNITSQKSKKYSVEKVAKDIYTFGDLIGLNLGTELHIINRNGWLIKKYVANQEINNVVISNKIVGIIYRDKIEIIDI